MGISIMAARYDGQAFWVDLSDDRTLKIPIALLPGLANATPAELKAVEITETSLRWNEIDYSVPLARLLVPSDIQPPSWADGGLFSTEYAALSAHYFHEDTYVLRAFGLFATINTALLTLYGSNLIVRLEIPLRGFFIALGLVITVAWAMSLIRVGYLRTKLEDWITELEKEIESYWQRTSNAAPFALLKIRNRIETAKYFPQRVPVSKLMLLIPFAFAVGWLGVLGFFIAGLMSRQHVTEWWLNAF